MSGQVPSKKLDAQIRRVNALIPSSVTPDTRIQIHPCDWLTLVDEIERLQRELDQARADYHHELAKQRVAPEPAAVPVSILREHWLTGVECDHDAKTDVATCYCSRWRSTPQANIPAAVDEWIKHLLEQQPASLQPPSAEQVLERGRQVEEQGLRLRYRVAEHPVPRAGFVLMWHEDRGRVFPIAWSAPCYHHAEMGANLYPPAITWEVISAPDSSQPPSEDPMRPTMFGGAPAAVVDAVADALVRKLDAEILPAKPPAASLQASIVQGLERLAALARDEMGWAGDDHDFWQTVGRAYEYIESLAAETPPEDGK